MVISVYDIQRAVADKATVPVYYESRIARLALNEAALPRIDAEFEEITEGEELTKKERLKTNWAALEALVGDPRRIALIAADLVAHSENRLEAMDGKVLIVCMSRRICVDLYNALIALRPEWASAKDDDAEAENQKSCVVKVVMTGSADQLRQALSTYTESGGQDNPTSDTARAVALMLEKQGIACDMLHGFNWGKWTTGKPRFAPSRRCRCWKS